MKNLLSTVFLLLLSIALFAQTPVRDTIFTRNGSLILCKVREIGTSEIKYIQPEINPDVLIAISKSKVERIIYSNGVEQQFERDQIETIEENSEDLFAMQRKSAVKIDFLGLAVNTLNLTYERCLRPGRSVEFSVGGIGLGFGLKDENAAGVLLKGGYKFAKNPDYYLKGMRYAHILKGKYLKLELDFASYKVEAQRDFFENREKYTVTKFAFLIVAGNQWILENSFLIDVYAGVGLGTNNLDDNDLSYPYGFATLGDEFPMAFSCGIRIGFLLK